MYLSRLLWPSTDLERPWVKCVFLGFFFFFHEHWHLFLVILYLTNSKCHDLGLESQLETTGIISPIYLVFFFPMCMCALCMYVCMCMDSHISNSVFTHVWRSGVDIGGLRPLSTSYVDSRSVPGARWLANWASQLAPRIPVLGLQAGD